MQVMLQTHLHQYNFRSDVHHVSLPSLSHGHSRPSFGLFPCVKGDLKPHTCWEAVTSMRPTVAITDTTCDRIACVRQVASPDADQLEKNGSAGNARRSPDIPAIYLTRRAPSGKVGSSWRTGGFHPEDARVLCVHLKSERHAMSMCCCSCGVRLRATQSLQVATAGPVPLGVAS